MNDEWMGKTTMRNGGHDKIGILALPLGNTIKQRATTYTSAPRVEKSSSLVIIAPTWFLVAC